MTILKSTDKDLELINQFSRRPLTAEEVYIFPVTLCDNDIDRDYEKFTVEALKALQPMFIGKTGILDHMPTAENQNSRIFETWLEKVEGQKTVDGEDLYRLNAKAYMLRTEKNRELIEAIDAGINKEVSVSCSIGVSKCSICGEKRGECDHLRGKEYDGELCFFTLEEPTDAYEFSFVAIPAQRGAGVTKNFDLEKGRECRTVTQVFTNGGFFSGGTYEKDGIRIIEEVAPDALKGAKLNDVVAKNTDGKVIARTKDGSLTIRQHGSSIFYTCSADIAGAVYISFTGKSEMQFERMDGDTAVWRRTIKSIGKVYSLSSAEGIADKSVESLIDGVIEKEQSERTERLNRKRLAAKKQILKNLIGG